MNKKRNSKEDEMQLSKIRDHGCFSYLRSLQVHHVLELAITTQSMVVQTAREAPAYISQTAREAPAKIMQTAVEAPALIAQTVKSVLGTDRSSIETSNNFSEFQPVARRSSGFGHESGNSSEAITPITRNRRTAISNGARPMAPKDTA